MRELNTNTTAMDSAANRPEEGILPLVFVAGGVGFDDELAVGFVDGLGVGCFAG